MTRNKKPTYKPSTLIGCLSATLSDQHRCYFFFFLYIFHVHLSFFISFYFSFVAPVGLSIFNIFTHAKHVNIFLHGAAGIYF